VSQSLQLTNCSEQFQLDLPSLVYSETLWLDSNLSSLNLPSLEVVGQKLELVASSLTSISLPALTKALWFNLSGNPALSSASFPNLTTVDESFSVANNPSLTTLSFPKLSTINGDFDINNNSAVLNIDGFPSVSTVGWDLDWTGSFDNASLPSLSFVGGRVNIQSSSEMLQCPIPDLRTNGVVKGEGFICSGRIPNPQVLDVRNYTNLTANDNGSRAFMMNAGTIEEG
jgi:hypothetical protein